MISLKNAANAVGGKTARPCDNCIKKRARWYCAADDAFLCQSCNSSFHSANPLARRHERVRLKTASSHSKHAHELVLHANRMEKSRESISSSLGMWHRGFVKKPRTPRSKKAGDCSSVNPLLIVPEVEGDEATNEENDQDEFLLYRVPAYDPSFDMELCNSKDGDMMVRDLTGESKAVDLIHGEKGLGVENVQGFLPTEADLAEFAADVESLLGRGLDNECFGIQELGLMDCKDNNLGDEKEFSLSSIGEAGVKLKEEETEIVDQARDGEIDLTTGTFELNFDYGSPTTCCEEEDKREIELQEIREMKALDVAEGNNHDAKQKRKMILQLDYESIITAWNEQGSPWANGSSPEFNPDGCWLDWMGKCSTEFQNDHFGEGGFCGGGHGGVGNLGREVKLSRYREKRRRRLFSKKIRYEVRKLNAEKRPRMKGRFIKRASSLATSSFPCLSEE